MKEEIKKFFKGDAEDGEETLVKYSHDASLLEVRPKLVLFPKDSEDVKNLVKWVSENGTRQDLVQKYGNVSITCRCAGTDMSGGAIGESIILDFTRYMNHLVKFLDAIPQSPKNSSGLTLPGVPVGTHTVQNSLEIANTITVEPGMFYRDFEKLTLEKGLILPCYTASKSLNAMGGMYGNNSAGERTLKYGKTEDYILSAKVILEDGNEYVVKPLSRFNLDAKMAQNNFEGNIYKVVGFLNENTDVPDNKIIPGNIGADIYPNPATDRFIIPLIEYSRGDLFSIDIYNSFGELMRSYKFDATTNNNIKYFEESTDSYNSGMYFVRIVTIGNRTEIKKIEILR